MLLFSLRMTTSFSLCHAQITETTSLLAYMTTHFNRIYVTVTAPILPRYQGQRVASRLASTLQHFEGGNISKVRLCQGCHRRCGKVRHLDHWHCIVFGHIDIHSTSWSKTPQLNFSQTLTRNVPNWMCVCQQYFTA